MSNNKPRSTEEICKEIASPDFRFAQTPEEFLESHRKRCETIKEEMSKELTPEVKWFRIEQERRKQNRIRKRKKIDDDGNKVEVLSLYLD